MDEEFSLDEARETLFVFQRACERHGAALGKTVELLNSKKEDDEWLLEVLDEAVKGVAFHEQQLSAFRNFHERVTDYIEAVRNEANQLALEELSGGAQRASSDGGVAEDGEGPEAAAATPSARPPRPKSSKIVHPELLKFKLEKQAKILGRYGGIPALGAGLVLPRLQRDSILKATGSAAAREIHYSKVENKDAPNLAQVMRFKVRKNKDDGPGSDSPAPSPWQEELSAKKGKVALDGTDAKDLVTPSTKSHTAYAEELGSVLKQRQVALEDALQAERTPVMQQAGPHISAAAMDELADKLRRRQAADKQKEDEAAAAAAAAAAEAAEAAATPSTPAWSNTAAPFGGELTAALQRRAEQQRQAAATPAGVAASGAAAEVSATPSAYRPPAQQGEVPAGRGSSSGQDSAAPDPVTPMVGHVMQARRSVPPITMTPPGAAVMSTELQAKLQRRLSSLDNPTPAPPAVASETQ